VGLCHSFRQPMKRTPQILPSTILQEPSCRASRVLRTIERNLRDEPVGLLSRQRIARALRTGCLSHPARDPEGHNNVVPPSAARKPTALASPVSRPGQRWRPIKLQSDLASHFRVKAQAGARASDSASKRTEP
jgi:hypothetical protein